MRFGPGENAVMNLSRASLECIHALTVALDGVTNHAGIFQHSSHQRERALRAGF
jgi:hypothetical protein